MMDIFNMLGGMGQAQQTASRQLGTQPEQTSAAMEAAVPLLLSALTRNAAQPGGLDALSNALNRHDGSAIDGFTQGQMPDMQDGQKILGHLFGNQQTAAANAVSRRAGIDPQMAMRVLSMAAPLVLAYLSRQRQSQARGQMPGQGQVGMQGGGLDIGSILGGLLGGGMAGGMAGNQGSGGLGGMLGSVLGGGQQQAQTGGMGNMGGLVGTLNNVLDRDGDGNGLEELIGMFGGQRRA